MGKKETRLGRIMLLLNERGGSVQVQDLAQELKVSDMTIRRDLAELQENQLLVRRHGGAVLRGSQKAQVFQNIENDYTLLSESAKRMEEKRRIGRCAAQLVDEGDVLILDNGSTTNQLAEFLPADTRLTVACFNLNTVQKLYEYANVDILMAGGYFHRSDMMFESAEGAAFLKGIRANKVFLSASGVHHKLGLTCAHNYEVPIKQAIIESALQKILLVDSSKFGTVKTVFFAGLPAVDVVITDEGIAPEWREILAEAGIRLITV